MSSYQFVTFDNLWQIMYSTFWVMRLLFSRPEFLFAFLPAVVVGYYLIFRWNRTLSNAFLTLASLFFYAWGEPWFVFVMMGSIVANWLFALLADRLRGKNAGRVVLVVMIIANLSIMFIFKYLVFTVKTLNAAFGATLSVPSIMLPIGISFFTFQAISYVIDVWRGHGAVQKNLLNVAFYIAFFPQLIAGPIVRYQTIAEQIHTRKENLDDIIGGLCRFTVGFCKKVLIANTMAVVADTAFGRANVSIGYAWLGAIAYTLQIFYDFSGYSDMAIGLGAMFGFKFLENFNYPYISKNITEFWRRWHISLGTWFRDYVYFPLGGSRVKNKGRLVFNLFVVWFLTGVWHGAAWNFLVWGLMYFVLIMLEKLTGFDKKLGLFSRIYTLLFVVMGWVIFRAANMGAAFEYIKAMFGLGNNAFDLEAVFALWNNRAFFAAAILFSMPIAPWLASRFGEKKWAALIYPVALGIAFVFAVSLIIKGAYNPFIYFNF